MATTHPISSLLTQWKDEGTTLLRVENHPGRHSSLDLSIKMSIEASRVARIPQTTELPQLLALLPSGIPEEFHHPTFSNIRRSASALKSSLLAYTDDVGRLRSLSPIRLYMLKHHPPPYALIAPLEQHYIDLSKLINKLGTSHTKPLLVQLIAEWSNVESICTYCLDNRELATWPVPVISGFDRLLVHVGLPKTHLLDRLLARPNLSDHDQLRLVLAKMLRGTSRQEELALGRHTVELAQTVDDLPLGAEARMRLGIALQGIDHAAADRYVFEALAVYQELGDAHLADQGMCWYRLAHGAFFSDQYAECLERGRLATACFEAADFPLGITTLNGLVAMSTCDKDTSTVPRKWPRAHFNCVSGLIQARGFQRFTSALVALRLSAVTLKKGLGCMRCVGSCIRRQAARRALCTRPSRSVRFSYGWATPPPRARRLKKVVHYSRSSRRTSSSCTLFARQ